MTLHLKTIGKVLAKLQEVGLTVKKEKCKFFKESVEYLGHHVDTKGIHMMKGKVKEIIEAPPPRDVSELKLVWVLVHYYGILSLKVFSYMQKQFLVTS